MKTIQKKSRWEDHYSIKAKHEKFPARSVYKLKEIQEKFNLIKKGQHILDLGCAPGSWLIYASEKVGAKGQVTGIDLKPVNVQMPPNVKTCKGDIFSIEESDLILDEQGFHLVMSDMAPYTTGNKHVDSARSFNLSEAALKMAEKALIPGGSFICKIFQSEDFPKFLEMVKSDFKNVKIYKPQSTRRASKEIYIIGIEKKPEKPAIIKQ